VATYRCSACALDFEAAERRCPSCLRRTTVRSDDDPPSRSTLASEHATRPRSSVLGWILTVILIAAAPIYGKVPIADDVCFGDAVILALLVLRWGSVIYRIARGRERQLRKASTPAGRAFLTVVASLIAIAFVLFGLYELGAPREMTHIAGKVSGIHRWSLGIAALAVAATFFRAAILVHREGAARD
jgi:hypothetical protein